MPTIRGKSSQIDDPINTRSSSDVVGTVQVLYGTVTYDSANAAAGDIYQVCRIPRGATVIGGYFIAFPFDVHTTTPTFNMDIGWEGNDIGFGDLGVANIRSTSIGRGALGGASVKVSASYNNEGTHHFQLGGKLVSEGPQTFTTDTIVTIKIIAVHATLIADFDARYKRDKDMTIVIYYFLD